MEIKEILLENDNLVRVLEHFEYANISETSKEIRCSMEEGLNATSVRIKKNENLSATNFATNTSGDIFSLIMENRKLEFKEVINQIKQLLGITQEYKKKEKSTFASLFSKVKKTTTTEIENEVYDEKILDNYEKCWNTRFLKDNISVQTQMKFNIGYDIETDRISIPWRNFNGEIIGVMGRDNTDLSSNKYFPLIAFGKINALYGYSENYLYLKNAKRIYIFESEKSVLQMDTFGYNNCVALGCNNLSDIQVKKLLDLNPEEIIIAYDESLDREVLKRAINNIKSNLTLRETKVGVLLDTRNEYMKKDSKCSPTDNGKMIFDILSEECVYIR